MWGKIMQLRCNNLDIDVKIYLIDVTENKTWMDRPWIRWRNQII